MTNGDRFLPGSCLFVSEMLLPQHPPLMEEDQCDLTSQGINLSHHVESPAPASTRPNSILIQVDESSHQDDQFNNEEEIHIVPPSQEEVGKLELAVGNNLAIMPFTSGSSSARVS